MGRSWHEIEVVRTKLTMFYANVWWVTDGGKCRTRLYETKARECVNAARSEAALWLAYDLVKTGEVV